MDFGNINTNIIKSGLVFNMDAANRASTIPSTSTDKAFNTINLSQSGSFQDDSAYDTSTITPSFSFDGTDDYIALSNTITFNGAFTYSVWIKMTALNRNLLGNSGTTDFYYINTSGHVILSGTYTFSTGLSTGQWYCITITRDTGNNTKIYINGLQNGSSQSASTTWNFNQIGRYQTGGVNDAYGNMTAIHRYNRALSASEVLHNYNALKSRFE
jgi:hypothetical protein